MDATEETISPKEMLEKIAELDYSQSQLRDLNAEMRHWLDVADDEVAMLRTENATLRKHVKAMEKIISEAQQVEPESCSFLLTDDLHVNKCSEKKIHDLLKTIEQERDQDKMTLSKLRTTVQTLEVGREEVEVELQRRDQVIHQKNLELKHLEETVEEFSNIIKELRLTKQELKDQLEDRRDEAQFVVLTELIREQDGSPSPQLSIAEEIQQLASSTEVKSTMTDSVDLRSETEVEELLEPCSLTHDLKTQRFAGTSKTAIQRAVLFILCIFSLSVLVLVALEGCAVNSIKLLWSSSHLMLHPCFCVQYEALPPI
ncbi:uncharacterized protein FYW49_006374 [Xenentodon cancila]